MDATRTTRDAPVSWVSLNLNITNLCRQQSRSLHHPSVNVAALPHDTAGLGTRLHQPCLVNLRKDVTAPCTALTLIPINAAAWEISIKALTRSLSPVLPRKARCLFILPLLARCVLADGIIAQRARTLLGDETHGGIVK